MNNTPAQFKAKQMGELSSSIANATITLPISEYEHLKKDAERMNWMDGEIKKWGYINFKRYGQAWVKLFSVSTQGMKQQPDVRAAIDQAMKDK
jgi:hypothetical protein